MPKIFGKNYSRQELRQRVGSMSQLAGIRSTTLNEGMSTGVRSLDFYTGSGLAFSVLPDRGMDIANASWNGIPLVWHSPTGVTHPSYYEAEGMGWLRGFFGGLMVTCGFMNVAVATEDNGEFFGLHGRASNLPAFQVSYDTVWDGDDYVLTATGKIRETRVFGENVLLTRAIKTRLGSNTIAITDSIENQGFEPTPIMILYHINAGFPILDETSELLLNSEVIPRDEEAQRGIDVAKRGSAPIPGFKEQVYQHQVTAGTDGWASAVLANREFRGGTGIGLQVRYRPDELPYFWQWRMVGEGNYVMGLEPANCHVMGRGEERRLGRIPILGAGDTVQNHLEISVLANKDDIDNASN